MLVPQIKGLTMHPTFAKLLEGLHPKFEELNAPYPSSRPRTGDGRTWREGVFPASTDDATKPKKVIPLGNPHTTGNEKSSWQNLRGRRAAHGPIFFRLHLGHSPYILRRSLSGLSRFFSVGDLTLLIVDSTPHPGHGCWKSHLVPENLM